MITPIKDILNGYDNILNNPAPAAIDTPTYSNMWRFCTLMLAATHH